MHNFNVSVNWRTVRKLEAQTLYFKAETNLYKDLTGHI